MTTTTRFLVPAMDCATEKDVITNRLERLDGVESLDVDLLDRVVTVRHGEGLDGRIEAALRDIGMAPKRVADASASQPVADDCCAPGAAVVPATAVERPSLAGAEAWLRQ